MTIVPDAPVASLVPRFSAFNRGITVAVVYAVVLLVGGWMALRHGVPGGSTTALFALAGFIAGAVAGFSNTIAGESLRRDLMRNVADAAMVSLWIAIALLTLNLVSVGAPLDWVGTRLAIFTAATIIGAAAGEPLLIFLSSLSIRGRRPFVATNRFCHRFHDPTTRFVAQVVLHTLAFLALVAMVAAVAMVVLIVVTIVLAIVIAGWIISAALNDGNQKTSPPRRRWTSSSDDPPEPVFSLKAGQRIDEQGRIVNTHWYGDERTGQKINAQGQIVEERFRGDEPTGYRIAEDGRLQREGLFWNDDVGVSVVRDDNGGHRVVQPGLFSDHDTNLRVDAQGRPIREGILFDDEQGFEIHSDGKVRKV